MQLSLFFLSRGVTAMSNLNVSEFNKQPKGHAGNRVDQNTFVQECKLALANVPLNSSQ